LRTQQRWKDSTGLVKGSGGRRRGAPTPSHALSEAAQAPAVANEPRFAAVLPARTVTAVG